MSISYNTLWRSPLKSWGGPTSVRRRSGSVKFIKAIQKLFTVILQFANKNQLRLSTFDFYDTWDLVYDLDLDFSQS